MTSCRKTLEQDMNNDDVTNHRKLFGYNLPYELESRILEQLDLKTLVTSRMVNSQWEAAVDNLSYLWSGLTRRLGIADACESGRERWRAQKMLGDCWVTSSFCPVFKESDTLEKDLKLSSVRLSSTGEVLTVTAFDPRSLNCHRWTLHLMSHDQSMVFLTTEGLRRGSVQAGGWVAILRTSDAIETLNAPSDSDMILDTCNSDGSSDSDDCSDNESDDEIDFEDFGFANSATEVADNADDIGNSEDLIGANGFSFSGSIAKETTENEILKSLPIDTTRDSVRNLLYAIVPLRRTPTNSVAPLSLLLIPSNEVVIQIVAQTCKSDSCSETQVLVLTNMRLMLYSLTPTTKSTDDSTTQPELLSSPHASIAFAETLRTNPFDKIRPMGMSIGTLNLDACINCRSLYFAVCCITRFVHRNGHYSLTLVRMDCRHIQQLSSVQLPEQYSLITVLAQTLVLATKFDTYEKIRLVRHSVSEQNCLQLDYDPCEYRNPLWSLWSDYTLRIRTGQRFWYCIGGQERSRLTLVIYLMGCPEPFLLVNISDLILQRHIALESNGPMNRMDQYISCTASTWIDFGFEPDSPDQTPLIAMGWEDDINLLFGLCCGPPKWPLSSRCLPVQISRNYQLDWPWLLFRKGAPC